MKIAGVGEHERFLAYKAGHARKNLRTTEIYRYRILKKKKKKRLVSDQKSASKSVREEKIVASLNACCVGAFKEVTAQKKSCYLL